jgi:hypothetical protein
LWDLWKGKETTTKEWQIKATSDTIHKPNFYSVASLLAACYLVRQIDKHDDNNLFIRILLDIFCLQHHEANKHFGLLSVC